MKNFIENICEFLKINKLIDLDCKYEDISNNVENYIGISNNLDTVKELRKNNFNKKNKIFLYLNYMEEYLPSSDIIIFNSKSSNKEIWNVLEKIRESKTKYILTNLNLSESPFYLPQNNIMFKDGYENLNLYKYEDVSFYLEEYEEKISLLRNQLIPYFDEYIKKIYNTFLKYENGEKLFCELILQRKELDWDKFYYNIKEIIDDGIFDIYIHLILLKYTHNLQRLQKESKYGNLLNNNNFVWANNILLSYIKYLKNDTLLFEKIKK